MSRVWGKLPSRILHFIRVETPYFRGKARLFDLFRRTTGYPRLTIPYAHHGWITVNDHGESLERLVWFHGKHETEVWNCVSQHLTANDVFWDAGANIGTVAIPALLDQRISQVHCFEPNPDVADRLQYNLSLNGIEFQVHRLALSSTSGMGVLYLAAENQSDMASLTLRRGNAEIPIRIATIDELIAGGVPPPTVMKIDVEGVEEQVLLGAATLLRTSPPKLIVFETECDDNGTILNQRIPAFLQQYGYRIEWIRRASGKLHFNENRYWENYAALRAV